MRIRTGGMAGGRGVITPAARFARDGADAV